MRHLLVLLAALPFLMGFGSCSGGGGGTWMRALGFGPSDPYQGPPPPMPLGGDCVHFCPIYSHGPEGGGSGAGGEELTWVWISCDDFPEYDQCSDGEGSGAGSTGFWALDYCHQGVWELDLTDPPRNAAHLLMDRLGPFDPEPDRQHPEALEGCGHEHPHYWRYTGRLCGVETPEYPDGYFGDDVCVKVPWWKTYAPLPALGEIGNFGLSLMILAMGAFLCRKL